MEDLVIRLKPRRVKIQPNKRRHKYISQLEHQVTKIEQIIDNPTIPDNIRLRAFNTLSTLIRTAYTMVNDYNIEQIEQQITELEKLAEENGFNP